MTSVTEGASASALSASEASKVRHLSETFIELNAGVKQPTPMAKLSEADTQVNIAVNESVDKGNVSIAVITT